MGFIENLRRQREQEEERVRRITAERARVDAYTQQQVEAARLVRKQRQARIRQEKERAESFLRQSEFPRMAQELKSLVGGVSIDKPINLRKMRKVGAFSIKESYDSKGGSYYSYPDEEPNSGLTLIWYSGRINEKAKKGYNEWEEIYRAIVVDCDSQGNIKVVNARRDIVFSLSAWKGNPNIQEEALGRAYSNPETFISKCSDKPSRGWEVLGR